MVTNITSTGFSVEWLPPAHSDRNGIIRNYSISLLDENNGVILLNGVNGNTTSFYFHSLHPAYTYSLAVAAATVSQGPYSDVISVTLADDSKFEIMCAVTC